MTTNGPGSPSKTLFTQYFKTLKETRYYISSLLENATLINNSIRSHWTIENNLHWNLDVIMKEDGQLNYVGNATEYLNMMKKLALGMLVNEKIYKKSNKQSEKSLIR